MWCLKLNWIPYANELYLTSNTTDDLIFMFYNKISCNQTLTLQQNTEKLFIQI